MKVVTVREPKKKFEATNEPRCVEAMNEEMQALSKNETWDLIPYSHHQKEIGCRLGIQNEAQRGRHCQSL